MRVARKFATTFVIAALAACSTPAVSPSPRGQDISFIGGCWEQHDAGNADFLRLLRDRENPGGFEGDQSRIRNGQPTQHSRWTFEPGGMNVDWSTAIGTGNAFKTFTPAPDLAAEDRAIPLGAKAAFFWGTPGQVYLKVLREDDMLRISQHAAKGNDARSATGHVYFEGRLSGCD